jgi:Fe-S-cluster containining protein
MTLTHLLERYERLATRADQAFQKMLQDYPECIKCKPHCSDCCHALFGLFLIEAVSIKRHFEELERKKRRAALLGGNKADRDLKKLEKKMHKSGGASEMGTESLAKERIRCPLLDDQKECILYPYRPITCRVYGIPTSIQGKARVCGKAGFKKGESYPAFDLDGVYKKLYSLSKELLKGAGRRDFEKALLLISVSKAIRTPRNDLINESFGPPGRAG